MRKGQSFETMMLVISVIVAVAILGILLGILNPGGCGGLLPTADPKVEMASSLKQVFSTGFGASTPKQVNFCSGTNVYVEELIRSSGVGVIKSQVSFKCKGYCGQTGSPLELAEDNKLLKAKNNIRAYVSACTKGKSGDDSFIILLSNDQDTVSEECMNEVQE